MKTIYLVRHGQTNSNLERIVGTGSDPLTELGKQQAELIAHRLKGNISVEAMLCSPYMRTRQTAEPIARELLGREPEYSDLLIESKRPIEIEGLSMSDPLTLKLNKHAVENWGVPNGHYSTEENFFDLSTRARRVLNMLSERPEENILVVTHGAFMKMIAEVVLLGDKLTAELSTTIYFSLNLSNTGVTVLTFDSGKWSLVRWNDTAHLEPGTESE